MSRWEFMRKLEELLSDISPGEREEALKYYNDYINDGGKENETDVLNSLGTPEQVAAIIKDGLEGNAGEFTESGFKSSAAQSGNPVAHYQKPKSYDQGRNAPPPKQGMSGGTLALVIILCIIFSPVILAACGAGFGIIVAIFSVLFALLLSFGIISVVFIVVGFALIITGIFRIFFGPLTGLAMVSVGLILGGLGILFFLLTALIVAKVIPAIFKGLVYLFESIFGGKKGVNNG